MSQLTCSWLRSTAASDTRRLVAVGDPARVLWTDDYLAAFAQAGEFTLATLDTKLPRRYPSVRVESLLP